MKLLRETIRKILLENNEIYSKIAKHLCARDPLTVNQGAELAKAMGYITEFIWDGGIRTIRSEHLFNHHWMLVGLVPELVEALESEWKGAPEDSHRMWPINRNLDGEIGADFEWHIVIDGHEKL